MINFSIPLSQLCQAVTFDWIELQKSFVSLWKAKSLPWIRTDTCTCSGTTHSLSTSAFQEDVFGPSDIRAFSHQWTPESKLKDYMKSYRDAFYWKRKLFAPHRECRGQDRVHVLLGLLLIPSLSPFNHLIWLLSFRTLYCTLLCPCAFGDLG